MATRYQVVLLGPRSAAADAVRVLLHTRVEELGLDPDASLVFLDRDSFDRYDPKGPAVGVYFGTPRHDPADLRVLDVLAGDGITVVPVVEDLARFAELVPEPLHPVNGMQVDATQERVQALAGLLLERLNLLRASRRLFISYRRTDSRSVAIQLYEALDARGFDVFLDTVSIRPGEPFQEELWHRLADTDVMVLLDTERFVGSRWTTEELARASSMSVGILQVVWPGHTRNPNTGLALPRYLTPADFQGGSHTSPQAQLTDAAVADLAGMTESLRARSLAARQDGLIREFQQAARQASRSAVLNPERYISLFSSTNEEIAVIPTVGVPDALRCNQGEDLVGAIRQNAIRQVYLVYDHRSLRDQWLQHLGWLDSHLPVRTLRITDAYAWVSSL